MANKTVYPYGTGGSLPSSIGIINDLTTGGADKALSAEQGKIIGKKINTYDAVVDDLYGVEREVEEVVNFSGEVVDKISLDASNFYHSASTSTSTWRAYVLAVPEGVEQVTITAKQSINAYLCITKELVPVGTISGSSIASNYMSTGCDGYVPTGQSVYRMVISANNSATIKLSKNAKYIYIQKLFGDNPTDYTPASMTFSGYVRRDGRLDTLSSGSNGVFDGISFVRGTLNENGALVTDETHLVSNPIPLNSGYYLQTNNPLYRIESVALFDANGICVNRNYLSYIQGVIGKQRYFGSVVCISGYYVRFVLEKQDGTAASLQDNIVQQFALFNDRRLSRTIPQNQKFQLFLERIKLLTNVVWKANTKVPAVPSKTAYFYNQGTVNIGIPYSELAEYNKYVGFDVSVRTFLTALLNPRSVMYTENVNSNTSSSKYGLVYHNYEDLSGAYYGTVCTGLTGYVLGFPQVFISDRYGTGFITGESVIAKGNQSNKYSINDNGSWVNSSRDEILELIQPMDLIHSPGHCSLISDIYTDEFGNRQYVVWTEETSGNIPTAKSTPMSPALFFDRLDSYASSGEWTINRYSNLDGLVAVSSDRESVPMEWFEYPKDIQIDPDICTYAGDYVVFQIGDPADTLNNNKAFLNIHRDGGKYDTLQIFAESADESTDTPVATVDISENSGTFIYNSTNIFADDAADKDDWIVVDLKQLPTALTHGKYKARVIKSGDTAASGFTHFQMVDVNFTVTGTAISDMVCNYSSEEGTPYYMRRERRDGLGSDTRQRSIPEGETSSTTPRNWGINATNRYVKVFVKADYGTAVKRIDVYGQFNS